MNQKRIKTFTAKAEFWDNVKRTELYEMMEESIPEMRISMPENLWNEIVEKAQVSQESEINKFTVDADLKFIYKNNEEDYPITFRVGGKSSAAMTKPGYNIKIKGKNQTLHGTKQFRLRSDQREASMMRSKITTDILQKSGLIAIEVGYAELYINDEYMGFWVVSDSIKNKWIERKFGDDSNNIKTLYQCKEAYMRLDDGSAKEKCTNANDEYADYMEPFHNFVDQVNAATSREDLEKIMDVDNFIKYKNNINIAWEYLMLSWDHFITALGHNLFWYQQPNGKWVYIPYDHDVELGQELSNDYCYYKPYCGLKEVEFSNISLIDYELGHPILKILIHDDDTKFRELVGDIISKVFNPDTLLIHIDKIKNLIDPYVKRDRESNAGRINKVGVEKKFSYEHFLLNTEYTYIIDNVHKTRSYGLKDWVRRRYNYVTAYYGINTNSTSLEEKHKLIEPRPEPVILPYKVNYYYEDIGEGYSVLHLGEPLPEYTPDKNYSDDRVPVLGVNQYILEKTSTNNETTKKPSNPSEPSKSCWSETYGYKCCSKGCSSNVLTNDEYGYWGSENGEWCGIPENCNFDKDECPGKKYGYPCCNSCEIFLSDESGTWGAENGEWCSIKSTCN
ncbi:hypothetical protein H8356DRAFT_1392576 [Neocallimastix lanati (nom. inval.)]|nr:hypothetical protein H8356DRAFT_1392576 [Neocallimastix sp. JGI-2020a]